MKYKTKIKICGIKKFNNAKCVLENKADYIGLIFVKKSRLANRSVFYIVVLLL